MLSISLRTMSLKVFPVTFLGVLPAIRNNNLFKKGDWRKAFRTPMASKAPITIPTGSLNAALSFSVMSLNSGLLSISSS